MNTFLKFLANFFTASVAPAYDRYLAGSVDIYDLERRMRHVDAGRHPLHSIGACGVSTH